MLILKNYKTSALVGALVLILAAIGLVAAQTNGKVKAPKVALKKSAAPKASGFKSFMNTDEESRRENFDKIKENLTSLPTAAATADEVLFKLKTPKLEMLGQPTSIFVDKNPVKEDRTVYIYYGDQIDGIEVKAVKVQLKVNFQNMVDRMAANKADGSLKADSLPFLIQVNGNEGWGAEPGYNVVGEVKEERPGFVEWQEPDGVGYTISGTWGPNGTSTKELLEIAATMGE